MNACTRFIHLLEMTARNDISRVLINSKAGPRLAVWLSIGRLSLI